MFMVLYLLHWLILQIRVNARIIVLSFDSFNNQLVKKKDLLNRYIDVVIF